MEMQDCKIIPGEGVVSQHRLLCAVLRTKEAKHRGTSREKDTNAEESWKLLKKVVMRAAEEICGTTKGGTPGEGDLVVE